MKITFETGDGSFEIVLDREESIPAKYNVLGVTVLRRMGNMFAVVKDYDQILDERDLA